MFGVENYVELFQYWQPVFWKFNSSNGWEAFQVYNCSEALPNAPADMLEKFNTLHPTYWSGWLCPDIAYFEDLTYQGSFASWSANISAY
jgi:hypothetical protein